jgi:signal peptidase I
VASTAENANKPAAEKSAQHKRTSFHEYVESLLVTVVLALFAQAFVVQAFKIPTKSMEPTLLVGDHLLVNKFVFGGTGRWYDRLLPYRNVRRGDVIVFPFPYEDHPFYVKRVIGLPGDRLKIIDERVYINGKPLDEPYAVHDPMAVYDPFMDDFPPSTPESVSAQMRPEWGAQILTYVQNGELVIPPGKYFAMGDNRDDSLDSRYWGFVDRDAIVGRPILIYWSTQSTEEEYENRGLAAWLRDLFDTLIHMPSRTRGSRMFHLVH